MSTNEDLQWRKKFFEECFNVDKCLSRYTQKSDLETLRKTLKKYGFELHEQMSEILKNETEEIVNLAENLTNLNTEINNLSLPVNQLREEIKLLYDLIKNAQINYNTTLNNIKDKNEKRNNLNLKLELLKSSMYLNSIFENDTVDDLITLECAINKYSFQYNYLNEIEAITETDISDKLIEYVNSIFLLSLKNNDCDLIKKCLRMYENLQKENEAEKIFRIKVVRPAMKDVFTEKYLENSNQNIAKIYDEALYFLDNKMKTLLEIIKQMEITTFNFILNSFWAEIDTLSREGLIYITAPGNPELFQLRYMTTWEFILKITKRCGNTNLIKTDSFKEHLERFNLSVYFEIKYQQIACEFEREILLIQTNKKSLYLNENNELNCKLLLTLKFWDCVKKCFESSVFIDNLACQFFHLSMLIFARYFKWFQTTLHGLTNLSKVEGDNLIMTCLSDLEIINSLNNRKGIEIPTKAKIYIPKILKLNTKKINEVINKFESYIIDTKYKECLIHLQNVASIPRLYRRTNKNNPDKPSGYMIEAVEPICKFNEKFHNITKNFLNITDVIIARITKEYLALVKEVLLSVCKTEESLRRLKKKNFNVNEESQNKNTTSDEMKIRKQIQLDVNYLLLKLYDIGLENSKKEMDYLKHETNNNF